tara:strand:+ start:1312 stop:2031 length:720 start_codon:yes stop_codon:yes gene_type:complete
MTYTVSASEGNVLNEGANNMTDTLAIWPTTYEAKLEKVSKYEALTSWEKGFLESLVNQHKKWGSRPSDRQVETLERIEEKHSPEGIQRRGDWEASFDDEKRTVLKVCAAYYKDAGYFLDLARNALSDDEFLPSEKQYRAMCENKYAKKVLKSHFDAPKFPVGSSVALRSTAPGRIKAKFDVNVGFVVRVDAKAVISAAKGGKQYEILPMGSTSTVFAEERYMKTHKISKKKKASKSLKG